MSETAAAKAKRLTPEEVVSILRYITESPPREHGGFHPNTVAAAAGALAMIAERDALADALRRTDALMVRPSHVASCGVYRGPGDVKAFGVALDGACTCGVDAQNDANRALLARLGYGGSRVTAEEARSWLATTGAEPAAEKESSDDAK